MTFCSGSKLNYTMQWSLYIWWLPIADCLLRKTLNTSVSFSAIWVLVCTVSLMICYGNAQARYLSVVSQLKYTMNWTVYIWCITTWISLSPLKSLDSSSAVGVVAIGLLCTTIFANAGDMTFCSDSQVNYIMWWSIYIWCLPNS